MTPVPTAPFSDLQAFLAFLSDTGRLCRVQVDVDKDWEVACIARWAQESTPDPAGYAILFEKVRSHTVPIAVNVYGSHAMYAAALGVAPNAVLGRWAEALAAPKIPQLVERAAVHEVIERDGGADLFAIPAPIWTPGRDAGPYLSAANVITKDPETGIQNLGTYRVQIHDATRAGLFFGSERQHGAMHYAKYCERGLSMPVAMVVGAAPVVGFAAAAKTAYGVDEMEIAGGLAGAGVEVVPGVTVDLLVPASAEYVIEGYVHPEARAMEGPFGEALGYMHLAAPAPIVEVTAICHRRAPVHHGYVQQLPPSEGHIVMELGVLGPLWYYLTRQLGLQGLCDLAIAPGSAGIATLVAKLERSCARDAAAIGRILAKINFGQKFIYLVDEDIDIRDPETLNWALSSRVDPQRDIQLVDRVKTFQLDPSVMERAAARGEHIGSPPYSSSMAIVNATLKCSVPEISLPSQSLMQKTLDRWAELGLPPIAPRKRLVDLFVTHSEGDLYSYSPAPHEAR